MAVITAEEFHRRALKLIPGGQADFVSDHTSPFCSFVAGMGAGKTFGAVAKALNIGVINAPLPYLFVEPTYRLVEDAALPAFDDVLRRCGVPCRWHNRRKVLTVGVGRSWMFEVWMRSGKNPEDIIGFQAGAGCIDEPGRQRADIFQRVVQRVRHPEAKIQQTALSGTPESLNWFYQVAEREPPEGMRLYRGRSRDNPFQTEGYFRNLTSTLSPQQREAYMEGKFVNLAAGRCYAEFDPQTHHLPRPMSILAGDVVVGCDFNVDKMCWVIGIVRGDSLHIIGEIIGENTNTYRQTDALIDWLIDTFRAEQPYMPLEDILDRVRVFTDAAGKRRETSANESDIAIMRSRGLYVVNASSNPPVRDRVNSVASMLRPGDDGIIRLSVDTANAKELTHCLNGQVWGPDGLPTKGRGKEDMSGAPDALGYLVWGHPAWRATMPRGNATRYQPSQSYL